MEKNYSVFYKYGDEVNEYYLTRKDAMQLAKNMEKDGYEVIVARKTNADEWETIYSTNN